MQVDQLPPNKPNFLLILILFCVTIIIVLVLGYFFVDFNSGHLGLQHHTRNPHAQLAPPPPALSPSARHV